MTRIVIDPQSLMHGASRAGAIGEELQSIGERVGALPLPEGTPPGVGGQLKSAGAQLARAGRSVRAQRAWLATRAHLAVLADTPLGPLADLLCPPLLNPFQLPSIGSARLRSVPDARRPGVTELPGLWLDALRNPPKNPPGPDFLWKLGRDKFDRNHGRAYALYGTALGLLRTAATVDYATNPLTRLGIGGFPKTRKRWHDETLAGLKFAKDHPREFAELIAKDATAYEDWKAGRHQFAAGRNEVDFAMLAAAVTKLGMIGKTARSARAAADAARMDRGPARLDHAEARDARAAAQRELEAKNDIPSRRKLGEADQAQRDAARRDAQAEQRLQQSVKEAEQAARDLRDARNDLLNEVEQSAAEKANTSGQSIAAAEAERERQRAARNGSVARR